MNPRRRHVLRLLPAAALAACTDSGGKVGIPFPKVPWRIASTTPFAADIVRQIGGQAVESICVLPADVPPHAFVPSAADIRKFHTSDMVVMHGLGLESRWPTRHLSDCPKVPVTEGLAAQ